MSDRLRIGLIFYTAGQKVTVEKGFQTIGFTSYDSKIGEQIFWFKSEADFHRDKREIFENYGQGVNRPVPHFEFIEPVKEAPVTTSTEAPVPAVTSTSPPPPPPPPALIDMQAVLDAHGGRKIRVRELAAELSLDPLALTNAIAADDRFQPLAAGWVRLKTELVTP